RGEGRGVHRARAPLLDSRDLRDVDQPLAVVDHPGEPGYADILSRPCRPDHGAVRRPWFAPRIEETVLHVDPHHLALLEILGGYRGPDRDLLDQVAADVPRVGLELLGPGEDPLDALAGHLVPPPSLGRDHAVLD